MRRKMTTFRMTKALLALFVFVLGHPALHAARPPNIVLIMADDLGYECIGANGGTSYRTPVLDGLAKNGVRFEHCYSQPLCTPSRVQIMTGIYNVRNYVKFGLLDRNETTFAHLLKTAGYATCIVGKWQLGSEPDSPRHFGFEESCLWQHTRGARDAEGRDTRYPLPSLEVNGKPVEYRNGEYGPDVVTDFLCDFMGRNRDRPFLAYYPMILPHSPFVPTPDSEDPGSRNQQANFADMVAYVDKMIGRIADKLDDLGIRENTLLLFIGDNGTAGAIRSELNGRQVVGGKGQMSDAGTRVPFIASWPGTLPEGVVSSDLVDFSDFLPTFCEMASVAVPEKLALDGRSFLPQLKGEDGKPRDWIYCWYARGGGQVGEEWARNQRYKLYRDGRFYDVASDVLEKSPLDDLSPEAQKVRELLEGVLEQYRNARPARAGGRKKKSATIGGVGDFEAGVYRSTEVGELPYRIHVPESAEASDRAQRFPLVLLFHGAGERGEDNRRQLMHGAGAILEFTRAAGDPAVIVVPQCPQEEQWVDTPWSDDSHSMPAEPSGPMRLAIGLLKECLASLPVDRDRVYVTGLSMGGFGAWDIVQRHPEIFAAALPVCGGGDATLAASIRRIPVWAFHGDRDAIVKPARSRDMIAALRGEGGSPRYTEYEGVGHDSWNRTYADPEVLAWLFAQKRPEEVAAAAGEKK